MDVPGWRRVRGAAGDVPAVTDALPLPIGVTIGRKYKILRVLGRGGMGAVYLAENLDLGRRVAIKVLHARIGRDPAAVQRFRQEARASAAVGHPGVIDVLDLGETDAGEPFIVMERLEGETLAARLDRRGSLPVAEAVAVLVEALDAIAAAHGCGVIHRDLKPENLFLLWKPRWGVKVLDFGLSRMLEREDLRITASNTVMGSVLYMPPEQARDARAAGVPADLYALGAVLYHALGGRPPFVGDTYAEVLSRVLTDEPVAIDRLCPGLPAELAALVMALLVKEPTARPASAGEVRDALRALVPEAAPPAPPSPDAGSLDETLPPAAALDETLPPTAALDETLPPTAALDETLPSANIAPPVARAAPSPAAAPAALGPPAEDRPAVAAPVATAPGAAAAPAALGAIGRRRRLLAGGGLLTAAALVSWLWLWPSRAAVDRGSSAREAGAAAIDAPLRLTAPGLEDAAAASDRAVDAPLADARGVDAGASLGRDAGASPRRQDAGRVSPAEHPTDAASVGSLPDAYVPLEITPIPPAP